MSQDIRVQFEVREMLIMKNTLKMMGYNYKEIGANKLSVSTTGNMLYGGMITIDENGVVATHGQTEVANDIAQKYMTEFYRDKAIREGNRVKEETTANGEIVLRLTR